MPDFYYSLPILPIHLFFLAFSFFWIIKSDLYGSQWIFGKVGKLNKIKLDKMHKYVNISLSGMIFTGALLLLQRPYLLDSIIFKIKIIFVIGLFINSFIIGKLMNLSLENNFKNLNKKNKIYLLSSGAVSTICWLGAFISAILR
jgi:hypothetical protein